MRIRPARDSTQTRLKVLEQAEALLFKYLDTCERLELSEEADQHAWQSMVKAGEGGTDGELRVVSRDQKIERFR